MFVNLIFTCNPEKRFEFVYVYVQVQTTNKDATYICNCCNQITATKNFLIELTIIYYHSFFYSLVTLFEVDNVEFLMVM